VFLFILITSATTTDTVESIGTHSQIQVADDDTYAAEEEEEEEYNELDMTGRIIADSYQIQSKLGAGSFGQVYLCEHIYSHEQWAMKIESHTMNNNPQLLIEVDN
jgi:serine/threonine protein kinase